MATNESDPKEFELRAVRLAQAIHDPSGTQGAEMYDGQERDAIFIDSSTINVYEFTVSQNKQKAIKDGNKIASLIKTLASKREHQYKASRGFFVTKREPTGDQRSAINEIARRENVQLFALSIDSLRKQLVDSEQYLQKRRLAPFGSTDMQEVRGNTIRRKYPYVEQRFTSAREPAGISAADIAGKVSAGERLLILGDYGGGKSEALRQAFEKLRSAHFKNQVRNKFPLHININDMQGLKTPVEIIRRHAEEVGYSDDTALISAWRSGLCDLLLDGFDELIPSRWVGGARDLRNVRKSALDPIRRLIQQTPADSGIVVSGRLQYFSGAEELMEVLGLPSVQIFGIDEFSDSDVEALIDSSSVYIPAWLPRRPLLVKYLHEAGFLKEEDVLAENAEADAWHLLFRRVASRESERIPSITAENVMRLIARVATLGRGEHEGLGLVSLADMQAAFVDVCNYEPEQEGLQLLQRLPGLRPESLAGQAPGKQGRVVGGEFRRFIDQSLADAAYGFDLANYIANPYDDSHPLAKSVAWNSVSGSISSAVAVLELRDLSISPGQVSSVVGHRMDSHQFDSILYEACLIADSMDAEFKLIGRPLVREILLSSLPVGQGLYMDSMQFNECVIESVDITESAFDPDLFPEFRNCLIQDLMGWSSIPTAFQNNFVGTEIETFSASSSTTSGILELALSDEDKIALSVLKKIYKQTGGARKFSALSRGLPLQLREKVQAVVDDLVKRGWIRFVTSRSGGLYGPVSSRRNVALAVLDDPDEMYRVWEWE